MPASPSRIILTSHSLCAECLDPSSRRPYYYCAPNDVWSLGVILVNLTCGRNPWKQASFEDSTYRAFTRSQDFLKTILPLSDELNDVLGRIFTRNPDERITLPELRRSILACPRFTIPAVPTPTALPTPPVSPEPSEYAACQDAVDDFACDSNYDSGYESGYESPLSPASDFDGESTCSSDDGSLISSCSTIDDEFDDVAAQDGGMGQEPQIIDSPESRIPGPQDYQPQYNGPALEPCQPCNPFSIPAPTPPSCAPRLAFPYFWEVVNRYVPAPAPVQHPMPFHHQVPLFNGFQGCY